MHKIELSQGVPHLPALAAGHRKWVPLIVGVTIGLAASPALADGQRLFVDQGCQVCHGGMGDGGVGPALRGNAFLHFPDYVIARILVGGGPMPDFADKMSDADIAAVTTYLRATWAGEHTPVSDKDVAAVRKLVAPGEVKQANAGTAGQQP
ncbi:MAG TPA: cytochrome c [Devosiaceae bacterium]|nr:cytochrome c [Devosiaceae bacterium]